MLRALREQNRVISGKIVGKGHGFVSKEPFTGDLRKEIQILIKRPESAKLGAFLRDIYDELARITNTYSQLDDLSDPETKELMSLASKELDKILDKLENL